MNQEFEKLLKKAEAYSAQQFKMPIDLFDLSWEFAELPHQELVVPKLISNMFKHKSVDVRRIALHACLRSQAYDVAGLKEAVAESLKDPHPWVRYDAAWVVKESKYSSPEIIENLNAIISKMLKEEADRRQKISASDAEASAVQRAYDALFEIGALKSIL